MCFTAPILPVASSYFEMGEGRTSTCCQVSFLTQSYCLGTTQLFLDGRLCFKVFKHHEPVQYKFLFIVCKLVNFNIKFFSMTKSVFVALDAWF